MNNFFAVPTDIWDDNAVMLTSAGVIIIVAIMIALVATALITRRMQTKNKSSKLTVKQLAFSGVAMAMAMVTSMLKLFSLPMGGSITLFSMLFIVLIGYWYGPYAGITTGMAYGLLQFVLKPYFYYVPQILVDYPLAFGALGLAGFFCNKKYGLQIGYIVGVLGRFVFAFLSGILFFASYAPEGMNAAVYSASYNGSYLLAEAVITLIILFLPPVNKSMTYVKKMATE